jgi:hypothetical protein
MLEASELAVSTAHIRSGSTDQTYNQQSAERNTRAKDQCRRVRNNKDNTYCSNVVLQNSGDGHSMFRILFGYDGQVADLEPVIRG